MRSNIPISEARTSDEYRRCLFPGIASDELLVAYLKGKTIADVGSGDTPFHNCTLVTVVTSGCKEAVFHCIDPQYTTAYANSRKSTMLHPDAHAILLKGTGENLPLSNESLDVYLSLFLFPWHVETPTTALAFIEEMGRTLKKNAEARMYPMGPDQKYLLFGYAEVRSAIDSLFDHHIFPIPKPSNHHWDAIKFTKK